ncbi:MAG: hypothetical protein QM757_46155 [Paludibaculum sp.]
MSRFKGLGEMMPAQLKETTMDPGKRTLARVTLPRSEEQVDDLVETLMGRKPELRFRFIQENAEFAAGRPGRLGNRRARPGCRPGSAGAGRRPRSTQSASSDSRAASSTAR